MDEFEEWCIRNGVYRDSNHKWQIARDEYNLESCPQCREEAWDGCICHVCGIKNI